MRTPDPNSNFNPYLPPIFRGETRLRQFGGTSNIWTGKRREFDRFELEPRAWLPYSGWLIDHDELRGSYAEVRKDYGFSDFDEFENSKPYALLNSKAQRS